MFERVKRLFRADKADAYLTDVATLLIGEGFSPSDLDELSSAASGELSARIVQMLRAQNLPPEDATHAIRLAAGLYQKTKLVAKSRGWPLKQPPPAPDMPPQQAYFLELLQEAARSLNFQD